MRFTPLRLALKYANRSQALGRAILLLLAALIITPWFVPAAVRELHLTLAGTTIRATVRGKGLAAATSPPIAAAGLFAHGGGRQRRPAPQIAYQFSVGGRTFGGSQYVTQDEWQRIEVGQALDVVFLPSDPQVNRLASTRWRDVLFLPLCIVCIGSGAGIFAIVLLQLPAVRHHPPARCNSSPPGRRRQLTSSTRCS